MSGRRASETPDIEPRNGLIMSTVRSDDPRALYFIVQDLDRSKKEQSPEVQGGQPFSDQFVGVLRFERRVVEWEQHPRFVGLKRYAGDLARSDVPLDAEAFVT